MSDIEAKCWRVGRTLGRTLYIQCGDEPAKGDVCVGLADTIPIARRVVDAMNGVPFEVVPGAHARGRLVLFGEAVNPAVGFSVCMDTPELAARVAQALNDSSSGPGVVAPVSLGVDDTVW